MVFSVGLFFCLCYTRNSFGFIGVSKGLFRVSMFFFVFLLSVGLLGVFVCGFFFGSFLVPGLLWWFLGFYGIFCGFRWGLTWVL